MNREAGIGFSQRVQIEWLDLTAHLYLAGHPKKTIEDTLQAYLSERLSVGSNARSGNRALTIGILVRTWVVPPKRVELLRDEGLQLLQLLPSSESLILHWGMAMAVYPFFQVVAETVGRLHRLQGTIAASQIQRRMQEQYGERSTVERATRRILRSFFDWGVLQDTSEKGIYRITPSRIVNDVDLVGWLVEASLLAKKSGSGTFQSLTHHPALFPFETQLTNIRMLEKRSRLEVFRQGVDEEVIMLLSNTKI